ncbi:hypothetical protein BY996DRAFT_6769425, partial [Phakopsora pachyrhizi]
ISSSIFLPSIISYIFLSFLSSAERCFLINSAIEIPLPLPELYATQVYPQSPSLGGLSIFNILHQFFVYGPGL